MKTLRDDRPGLLLVDDEEGFRTAVARRLGKRGFLIFQASNGEQCLTILDKDPVNVVILDVKMPGMSGIDTLKTIKQAHPEIQVILLTGNVAVADGIEGIKSGAFDYLTKPVEIDHLVNKINQALEMIRLGEEKLAELAFRADLEKKMIDTDRLVSLGTMSTGIAHEINNPLAVINEAAGFMRQVINQMVTGQMDEGGQKTKGEDITASSGPAALLMGLEKIETSVKRARRITHQLLGHVKKQDVQFCEVNLKTLLSETLDLLKNDLQEKNIQIDWNMDPDTSVLWSDPFQIRQVLMNILNNAVHAVTKKGVITLCSKRTEDDIVLEVRDNGVGIPKENLGKIFDPFFTTKSFEQGTGLGLFVVHKILSNLNGDIRVDSTVGRGSSFKIRLPRRFDPTGLKDKINIDLEINHEKELEK